MAKTNKLYHASAPQAILVSRIIWLVGLFFGLSMGFVDIKINIEYHQSFKKRLDLGS